LAVTTAIVTANATSTALTAITSRPWRADVGKRWLRIPTAETTTAQATSNPAAMKNGVLLRSWNTAAARRARSTARA
jgi:hypothetical protein